MPAGLWEKTCRLFTRRIHITGRNIQICLQGGILAHEINKFTLCDNAYAKQMYGWEPRIGMEEGLRRVISHECALLDKWKEGKN